MAIATVNDRKAQAEELQELLGFEIPAIAITFQDHVNGARPFGAPLAQPAADGRTGSVAAGCVFWMHATDRTFSTLPSDHGNCSVGMMTHGLATLDEVAGNADVAEILASGWVSMEAIPGIPVVKERAESIVYGPFGGDCGGPRRGSVAALGSPADGPFGCAARLADRRKAAVPHRRGREGAGRGRGQRGLPAQQGADWHVEPGNDVRHPGTPAARGPRATAFYGSRRPGGSSLCRRRREAVLTRDG